MTKKRKLLRLQNSIYNTPHLITAEAFSQVVDYLNQRNMGLMTMIEPPEQPEEEIAEDCGGVGVINVHGTLTNKPVEAMCGEVGTSYEELLDELEDLIECGCKIVVFDFCTGGGEGFNCFATGEAIRKMADDNGVYLISYVQNMAASAGYALCVVSDEVVCHPQGMVGSIGVLIELYNDNKAMQMQGISRTFITAGENKIPFDAEGEFKPEFIADLQDRVDSTYQDFCDHVSKFTGLSKDVVMGTQASMFSAKKALEMGMINYIMNNEEFATYVMGRQATN